ncbi:MAG: hypothetical protein J6N93_07865 [Clostridia bacterium]|nr:hypothetical protein [Clostridia bacterium]
MRKVIFLDLDGVLNSRAYDRIRDLTKQSYIDETRLPLLKRIIDETGAEIVFSSTWRKHWDKDEEKCDEDGKYINDCFAKFGLKISDKTFTINNSKKNDDIAYYLETYFGDIYNYVILDDDNFDWTEKMRRHFVKTNAMIGRGLNEEHVVKAIEILNKKRPKYEVIGWASYDDNYPNFDDKKGLKHVYAARIAIIENIRQNGYAFGGDAHQNVKGCCPVLNSGEAYRCSMREWGGIMAEAWSINNDDKHAYMVFYMNDFGKEDRPKEAYNIKYPQNKVNRDKIIQSDEEFDVTIPENYYPYGI